MRNYFAALALHRASPIEDLKASLESEKQSLEADYQEDMRTVLLDVTPLTQYRRLHLQYDAMAAVLGRGIAQQDSNSWEQRVVEFSPEPNELP